MKMLLMTHLMNLVLFTYMIPKTPQILFIVIIMICIQTLKKNCYESGNRGVDRQRCFCASRRGYGRACGTCSKNQHVEKSKTKKPFKPATVSWITIEGNDLFMNINIMAPFRGNVPSHLADSAHTLHNVFLLFLHHH